MGNNRHKRIAEEENQLAQEKKASKLNIFVVDEQPIFRQGLRKAVSLCDDIEVVGECAPGADMSSLVENRSPDIVVLGVNTSVINRFGVVSRITRRCPKVAVVVLAPKIDDDQLFQAMKSGAAAYSTRNITPDELVDILRGLGRGEYPINDSLLNRPNTARQVLQLFHSLVRRNVEAIMTPLSCRELEILKYVAEGNQNKRIALALNISEQTVKNHITSILRKLKANDRTHAVILAARHGWLDIEELSVIPVSMELAISR